MSDAATPRGKNKPWRRLVAIVAYAVIVALAIRLLDVHALVASIQGLSGTALASLFALALAHVALRALRFHILARLAGANIAAFDSAHLFVAGLSASTVTPGRTGDFVKAAMLKKHGLGAATGAGIVVVERVFDLLALTASLLAAATLAASRGDPTKSLVAAISFAGLLLFVIAALSSRRLRGLGLRIAVAVLRRVRARSLAERLGAKTEELFASWDLVFRRPSRAAIVFVVSLVAWAFEFGKLGILLGGLGVDVPLYVPFLVYPLSILAGILSLLPFSDGAVGVAGVSLLAAIAKVDVTVATVAMTIDRSTSVLLPVLLTGVTLPFVRSRVDTRP